MVWPVSLDYLGCNNELTEKVCKLQSIKNCNCFSKQRINAKLKIGFNFRFKQITFGWLKIEIKYLIKFQELF